MNPSSHLHDGLSLNVLKAFETKTLIIESQALRGNPLGDPTTRRNPILIPVGPAPSGGYPVVLTLSGLFGNGTYSFNLKSREPNVAETLDACVLRGEAPKAIYVFCDAMTAWGGSQFLNSEGTGRYEDFIVSELVPALRATLPVQANAAMWCVTGGSSGGYGALHLGSRCSNIFGLIGAIAPDSFFEASLVPDLYTAAASLRLLGAPVGARVNTAGLREELESGRLKKRKDWHAIANAVAMGLCYAPLGSGEFEFPLDFETGRIDPRIWARWKEHDPVSFLEARSSDLKQTKRVYLDVGRRDQFQLLYGTRQIRDLLNQQRVSCDATEFEGSHFDIGERRPQFWKWLREQWSLSFS